MKLNKKEFFESIRFKDDLHSFIYENDLDEEFTYGNVKSECLGFADDETQAKAYFKACVYQNTKHLSKFEFNEKIYYLLFIDEENREYTFYTSKKEALADYEAIATEDYYKPIEELVDEFLEGLHDFSIKVKSTRNHGYFVEYNVYYNDDLIVDGAYKLDEELKEECLGFLTFKEALKKEYNLYIDSIIKESGSHFDKYYKVVLSNEKGNTVEVSIDLSKGYQHGFYQGIKRSFKEIFETMIDIDDILEQLKDEK